MRMDDYRVAKKVLKKIVDGTRTRERPRKRWIENVEKDLQELGVRNWKATVEDHQR